MSEEQRMDANQEPEVEETEDGNEVEAHMRADNRSDARSDARTDARAD
jgi:hypothetical protein